MKLALLLSPEMCSSYCCPDEAGPSPVAQDVVTVAAAQDEAGPPPPAAQDVVHSAAAQDEAGRPADATQDEVGPPPARDEAGLYTSSCRCPK